MPDEEQVAGKQGRGVIVEDRQVVVGMGGRPGLQGQAPATEIDLHLSSTSSVGGTICTSSIGVAEQPAKGFR